jgi:hypothetical protein
MRPKSLATKESASSKSDNNPQRLTSQKSGNHLKQSNSAQRINTDVRGDQSESNRHLPAEDIESGDRKAEPCVDDHVLIIVSIPTFLPYPVPP